MPASTDDKFYAMLDSIAQTVGNGDAVQQNKHMKEEEFAKDSAAPNEAQTALYTVLKWVSLFLHR